MSYNKTLFFGGEMKNENEIKDENEVSFFMSKVHNSSAPKMNVIVHHSSPSLRWGHFGFLERVDS